MPEGNLLSFWISGQLALLAIAVGLQFRRMWRFSGRADTRVVRSYYDDNRDFTVITLFGLALIVLDLAVVAGYGLFEASPSFRHIVPQIFLCPLLAFALIVTFEGAVKGEAEPLIRFPWRFRRDEQPVRYWLSMTWNGISCVILVSCVFAILGVIK